VPAAMANEAMAKAGLMCDMVISPSWRRGGLIVPHRLMCRPLRRK